MKVGEGVAWMTLKVTLGQVLQVSPSPYYAG